MEIDDAITCSDLSSSLVLSLYFRYLGEVFVDINIIIRLVTSWEISFQKVTLIEVSMGEYAEKKINIMENWITQFKRELETYILQVRQLTDETFHLKKLNFLRST